MTSRMVVDTNVFVEALFGVETSDSANLFASLDENALRLVFSQDTIGELMYTVKRICNKRNFSPGHTRSILRSITDFFQLGKSTNTRKFKQSADIVQINDPDDQMFVEAAYASNADYVITLDKKSGLLDLEEVPFLCYTPKEFLQSIS